MYIHLPLPSPPFLFLFWGDELVRFTVSSVCYYFWRIQERKWILWSYTLPVLERLRLRNLLQLWEGEQPEFSWLKAVPINEFEAQYMLCKRTLKLVTQSASESLQRSHTITDFDTPLCDFYFSSVVANNMHRFSSHCMLSSPIPLWSDMFHSWSVHLVLGPSLKRTLSICLTSWLFIIFNPVM